MPHGGNKNAIFQGPNDRQYQVLNTWVKSLKAAGSPVRPRTDNLTRTGSDGFGASTGEGFAADRSGRSAISPSPAPAHPLPQIPGLDFAAEAAASAPPPPSRRIIEHFEEEADFRLKAGDNPQFPTPFVAGGAPPAQPSPTAPRPLRNIPTPATPPSPPAVPPKTATTVAPGVVSVGPADDPNQLPGMNQPLYPTSAQAESDPAKKKAKKIDNALLEKMIKSRNGTP